MSSFSSKRLESPRISPPFLFGVFDQLRLRIKKKASPYLTKENEVAFEYDFFNSEKAPDR
jgi:hypothetical protein